MFGLPSDLQSLLNILALGSGAIFSQLENWDKFKALPPLTKLVVQAGLSALGAIGLVLLLWASPAQVQSANQLYTVLYQIAATIIANLGAHVGINMVARPAGKLLKAKAGMDIGPRG